MKGIIAIAIGSLSLLGYAANNGSAQMSNELLSLSKTSKVWLDGTSNVRSFSCSAQSLQADVNAEPGADPASIVKSAALVIPVGSLDCRNGTMNEHMRKALKADKNPQIKWRMTSYTVEGTSVSIQGFLTIAGTENPIELKGTGSADNGVLRFKGTKQFKMTEYGVKPPTMMFGAMKVNDPVTVGFDIALEQ
jgi:polyisoprenoid-binding protein YceI